MNYIIILYDIQNICEKLYEEKKRKKRKIAKLMLGVSVSAFMLSGCTKDVKDEQMSVKVLNESVDGTYTGKVEKKEAEGTGKFVLGNKSVVEGKFHEGKFLQGTLTNYEYHFKWVPGKDEKYEFDGKFSGKVKKEKFFSEKTRKQNKKTIKKAKEFKYKSYAKEPSAFTPKIVKASKLHVVSIGTVDSTYENKNTWVLLADSNYSKYYYVNYSGRAPGVVEESVVDIYFLPVAYTTYKTINETQNYAACGQAA